MSEMVMFLLRPFFARALHECPENPSKSKYGEAFLAITERCVVRLFVKMEVLTEDDDIYRRQLAYIAPTGSC